jgi:hypothetical protein
MYQIIYDVSMFSSWIMVIVVLIADRRRAGAVKGTAERYMATTYVITARALLILCILVCGVSNLYTDGGLESNVWWTSFCIVISTVHAYALWRIMLDDDDHWFTDMRKKMKRWASSIGRLRRLKPAYAR